MNDLEDAIQDLEFEACEADQLNDLADDFDD
jgi:hypothetical protein